MAGRHISYGEEEDAPEAAREPIQHGFHPWHKAKLWDTVVTDGWGGRTMSGVAVYIGEKALELLASRFKDGVIQRWSVHRSRQFLDALVLAVGEDEMIGSHPDKVNALLDKAMTDEVLSSSLFDAYRRVCLSASRDIGPRIIGYVMGRVLLHEREPTEEEEAIFRAAEHMNDYDLLELAQFVEENRAEAEARDSSSRKRNEPEMTKQDGLRVHCGWEQEEVEGSTSEKSIGPMNLALDWGAWAGKAEWLGLARQEVTAHTFNDPGSHYHDGGPTRQTDWWLTIEQPGIEVARLVRVCTSTGQEKENTSG